MWRLIAEKLLGLFSIAIANHSNFMPIDEFPSKPTTNAEKRRDNDRDQ